MKSLSQSEYGELRSLYSQVYAPKFETILDEMTDQEVNELTEEIIEETVEEFFLECLEEGFDIDSVEETLCESLETSLTMLNEVSDSYYADAVKSGKAKAAKAKRAEMIGKVKGAVKKVGSALKSGAKLARKGVVKGSEVASKAVGHAKNLAKDVGSAAKKGYDSTQKSSSSSSDSGSSDSGSSSPSSSSSPSGSSSSSSGSSSSGSTRKAVGGAVRKVGSLLKKGLKKAIGGTARAVEKGAGKVARRMGEELEATGLFTAEEIESILEAEINEGSYEDRIAANNKKYDANRKRAAQRAAARNAARDAGQTGAVKGVGYVTPRREKETYTDSAGKTRHAKGL
jgi:hypothetical protein